MQFPQQKECPECGAVTVSSRDETKDGLCEECAAASGAAAEATGIGTSSATIAPADDPVAAEDRPQRGSGGRSLGRFQLIRTLGQGGFGRVYEAYDPQLDRSVALKVPTFGPGQERYSRRFMTEAKAAARLRHPNIVATLDYGRVGGRSYIATQFVEGETLASLIKEERLPIQTAVTHVRKLAEALSYAHIQGVVHRDVKPQNILIDERGEPQLLDFGLAKVLDDDSSVTTDGALLGTPAYMSPEQARGDTDEIGPASDQYSLAVVLYELVTGSTPFRGSPHVVLSQVASQTPPAPKDTVDNVSEDLNAIIEKAMSQQPEHRYQGCGPFASDLARWIEGRPVLARPLSATQKVLRLAAANPIPLAAVALIVVLLTIATAVSVMFYKSEVRNTRAIAAERDLAREQRGRLAVLNDQMKETNVQLQTEKSNTEEQRRLAVAAAATAETQRKLAESALADVKTISAELERNALAVERRLYASQISRAMLAHQLGDGGSALELLESGKSSTSPEAFEWRYVDAVVRQSLEQQFELPEDVTAVHVSRHHVYAVTSMGQLAARSLTAQTTRSVRTGDSTTVSVQLSRDGQQLVTVGSDARQGSIRFWSAGALTPVTTVVIPQSSVGTRAQLAVSRTGENAAVISGSETELYLCDSSGNFRTIPALPNRQINDVWFLSDQRLLFCDGNFSASGQIWSVDLTQSDSEPISLATLDMAGRQLCGSSDGRMLYAADHGGEVYAWSVRRGAVQKRWTFQLSGRASGIVLSADDGILTAGLQSGAIQRLQLNALQPPSLVQTCFGHTGRVDQVFLESGNSALWSFSATESRLLKWSVADEPTTDQDTEFTERFKAAAFSRDGRAFALGGWGRRVLIRTAGATTFREMKLPSNVGDIVWRDSQNLIVGCDNRSVYLVDTNRMTIVEIGKSRQHATSIDVAVDLVAISGLGGNLYVDDLQQGRRLLEIDNLDMGWVQTALSSDGRVAVSGRGKYQILDCGTKAVMTEGPFSGRCTDLRFSADNRLLAVALESGEILLWDVEKGARTAVLSGHRATCDAIRFTDSDRRLVSGARDGTLRIWDLELFEELVTIPVGFAVLAMDIDRNGTSIVAAGEKGAYKYIPLDNVPVSRLVLE